MDVGILVNFGSFDGIVFSEVKSVIIGYGVE